MTSIDAPSEGTCIATGACSAASPTEEKDGDEKADDAGEERLCDFFASDWEKPAQHSAGDGADRRAEKGTTERDVPHEHPRGERQEHPAQRRAKCRSEAKQLRIGRR